MFILMPECYGCGTYAVNMDKYKFMKVEKRGKISGAAVLERGILCGTGCAGSEGVDLYDMYRIVLENDSEDRVCLFASDDYDLTHYVLNCLIRSESNTNFIDLHEIYVSYFDKGTVIPQAKFVEGWSNYCFMLHDDVEACIMQ